MEPSLKPVGFDNVSLPVRGNLARLRLLIGGIGLVLLMVSFLLGQDDPRHLWHAYLVAALFFISVSLGASFFVLVQWTTRAGWSVSLRRPAEHLMGLLPVLGILSLPLGAALTELYPWARSGGAGSEEVLPHQAAYLSSAFFYLRSLFYLVSWSAVAWWFRRQSLRQDGDGGLGCSRRLRRASAPALAFLGLTVTFAAFDWIMSLEPGWYSTIFGVYFFSGAMVSGLAAIVLVVLGLRRIGLLSPWVTPEHDHDMGKLLFGFVCFWAYIAFSQFLLIWYANLPEETLWYAHRMHGGWERLSWALAVGHFVLPFFFFLPRRVKRTATTLWIGAAWLLLMHYLDLYWLIMPGAYREGLRVGGLELSTLAGFGGVSLAVLIHLMLEKPLIPAGDPRLSESLSFRNI